MSTAKLVVWLHWQVTWVRFLDSSPQPLADQPPVPPGLRGKGGMVPSATGASPRASRPLRSHAGPSWPPARHHHHLL